MRELLAAGSPGTRDDLAALSPYRTRHLKRFGDYAFTTAAPAPFDGELVTPLPPEGPAERRVASA